MADNDRNGIGLALATAMLQNGLGIVPDKNEYGAPDPFDGEAKELDRFLKKVQKIITAHKITTEKEKVEILFSYLSGQPKRLLREHPSFKSGRYDEMIAALRAYYPSSKNKFRFDSADLEKVVRKHHKKPMRTLEDAASYQRKFELIGLWCLNNKIEVERYNRLFWDGLPTKMQEFLKHSGGKYGISIDPLKTPDATEVAKALRAFFNLDNFDAELRYKSSPRSKKYDSESDDSDSDAPRRKRRHRHRKGRFGTKRGSSSSSSNSSSPSDDSDSSSDSSDSDSEITRSKRMTSVKATAKVRFGPGSTAEAAITTSPAPPASSSDGELDELTRRLAGLDVNSVEYKC
ncbi:hypothetical protein V8E36_002926 [Tilletia maclaganii]